AAISAKGSEGTRERTYGAQFIAYHPYYYRGVAYLNKGVFDKAVEDLRRAKGVGELNLGEPDSLLIGANDRLVAQQLRDSIPAPQSVPAQPQPTQPQPTQPRVDPALEEWRNRAQQALGQARSKMGEAQRAQAGVHAATEFNRAAEMLQNATGANVTADSVNDFRTVADQAERATRAFEAAITAAQVRIASQPQPGQPRPTPPIPTPQIPPSTRATEDVLAPVKQRLREALQAYFEGNFQDSARQFQALTGDQSNNPMIWAFLGASKYYDYYLNGRSDASALETAKNAFRRARSLNPRLSLSPDYFSPRVVAFYEEIN
ncbi:MAG TPA: hypothetical protein VM534_05725, partial [Thermoanaerobaculia bacterium]|nr:hypothetical protein [Thermoanaerobaculia bacterium]